MFHSTIHNLVNHTNSFHNNSPHISNTNKKNEEVSLNNLRNSLELGIVVTNNNIVSFDNNMNTIVNNNVVNTCGDNSFVLNQTIL